MTISPMTPPGTEVVCINDELYAFALSTRRYYPTLDGLTKGKIYTVRKIIPSAGVGTSNFSVIINEIDRCDGSGYAIERFRYLNLAGLDELLKVEVERKVDEKV